jgi:hypothetical protein
MVPPAGKNDDQRATPPSPPTLSVKTFARISTKPDARSQPGQKHAPPSFSNVKARRARHSLQPHLGATGKHLHNPQPHHQGGTGPTSRSRRSTTILSNRPLPARTSQQQPATARSQPATAGHSQAPASHRQDTAGHIRSQTGPATTGRGYTVQSRCWPPRRLPPPPSRRPLPPPPEPARPNTAVAPFQNAGRRPDHPPARVSPTL